MKTLTLITTLGLVALASGCAQTGGYSPGYSSNRYYEQPAQYERPTYDDRYVQRHDRQYQPTRYESARYANEPAPAPQSGGSVLPQVAGAVVGGVIGSRFGQGNGRVAASAIGAATGAYAAGKLSDPCSADLNAGNVVGGIAGALLGATVGRGNGRIAGAAVGAAAGSVVGGRMSDTQTSANCR